MKEVQRQIIESQARQEKEIENHTTAILDLIVISRTFLDSLKELAAQIEKSREEWRETQRVTDESLTR